jgi:hypothetical protein
VVIGTESFVISNNVEAPPKSKYFLDSMNDFVLGETYLDQAYFWTKDWQEGEKEADEDIKRKRVKDFKNAKGVIKHLHSKRK